jgi:CheY-like chemotaxis protein
MQWNPKTPRPLVLVADDCEDTRAVVTALLQQAGYRTAEAADGLAAVDLARALRPAVILMDFTMPVMDGLMAATRITEDPACRGVRVVLFTAAEEIADLGEAVGVPVVTKPADRRSLLLSVERAISLG